MGQLFPRGANLLARLSVYGIFVVAALGVIGLVIYSRSPYPAFAQKSPTQPVPFSHALHVGLKIDCHRAPEQYLRPQDQIFNTDWQPPADQLAQGRQLVQANHIEVSKLTNCTICHR